MSVDEAARARVPADRVRLVRLLRRRSEGQPAVRELARRARRAHRRATLALPARAPRSLGLRSACAADPGGHHAKRRRPSQRSSSSTKMGLVFVFDRETGQPVFGVEERPVPPERRRRRVSTSPTQPFPLKPLPLARIAAGDARRSDDASPKTSRRECEALFDRREERRDLHAARPDAHGSGSPARLVAPHGPEASVNPALQVPVREHERSRRGRTHGACAAGMPLAVPARQPVRRRVRALLGLATAAVSGAALGTAERDRSGDRRHRVAGAARRRAAAGRAAASPAPARSNLGGSVATGGGLVFIGGAPTMRNPRVRRPDRTRGLAGRAAGERARDAARLSRAGERAENSWSSRRAAEASSRPRSPTRLSPSRSASEIGTSK